MKFLSEYLISASFWEDGRVMIVFAVIIGLSIELIMWKITKVTQKKRQLFIPLIICMAGLIFGGIMIFFPNGTGGVTQHFYLGIFSYSLSTLIAAGISVSIILILQKLRKHQKHS